MQKSIVVSQAWRQESPRWHIPSNGTFPQEIAKVDIRRQNSHTRFTSDLQSRHSSAQTPKPSPSQDGDTALPHTPHSHLQSWLTGNVTSHQERLRGLLMKFESRWSSLPLVLPPMLVQHSMANNPLRVMRVVIHISRKAFGRSRRYPT